MFKKMQEDMVAWQAGYHEAERSYYEMNEQLMQEVPLSTPAETRPEDAVNSPIVSIPPVTTSQFTIPSTSSQPQSSVQAGQDMDANIQARWANVSALRKSYPSAPLPANWGSMGFNVSTSVVQDSQACTSQFFNFIGSSAGNEQSLRKAPANISVPHSTPITYPETQCEPGYYMCPFDGTKEMTADNLLVLET